MRFYILGILDNVDLCHFSCCIQKMYQDPSEKLKLPELKRAVLDGGPYAFVPQKVIIPRLSKEEFLGLFAASNIDVSASFIERVLSDFINARSSDLVFESGKALRHSDLAVVTTSAVRSFPDSSMDEYLEFGIGDDSPRDNATGLFISAYADITNWEGFRLNSLDTFTIEIEWSEKRYDKGGSPKYRWHIVDSITKFFTNETEISNSSQEVSDAYSESDFIRKIKVDLSGVSDDENDVQFRTIEIKNRKIEVVSERVPILENLSTEPSLLLFHPRIVELVLGHSAQNIDERVEELSRKMLGYLAEDPPLIINNLFLRGIERKRRGNSKLLCLWNKFRKECADYNHDSPVMGFIHLEHCNLVVPVLSKWVMLGPKGFIPFVRFVEKYQRLKDSIRESGTDKSDTFVQELAISPCHPSILKLVLKQIGLQETEEPFISAIMEWIKFGKRFDRTACVTFGLNKLAAEIRSVEALLREGSIDSAIQEQDGEASFVNIEGESRPRYSRKLIISGHHLGVGFSLIIAPIERDEGTEEDPPQIDLSENPHPYQEQDDDLLDCEPVDDDDDPQPFPDQVLNPWVVDAEKISVILSFADLEPFNQADKCWGIVDRFLGDLGLPNIPQDLRELPTCDDGLTLVVAEPDSSDKDACSVSPTITITFKPEVRVGGF